MVSQPTYETNELNLKDIKSVLKRNWRIILALSLIGLIIGGISAYYRPWVEKGVSMTLNPQKASFKSIEGFWTYDYFAWNVIPKLKRCCKIIVKKDKNRAIKAIILRGNEQNIQKGVEIIRAELIRFYLMRKRSYLLEKQSELLDRREELEEKLALIEKRIKKLEEMPESSDFRLPSSLLVGSETIYLLPVKLQIRLLSMKKVQIEAELSYLIDSFNEINNHIKN